MNNVLKQKLEAAVEIDLAEVFQFAPGRHAEIAKEMSSLMALEKPLLRQTVERWVAPNRERREHMRLGYAIFLKMAVNQLKKRIN